MQILEPFHGAVLNHHDGRQTDSELTIAVRGQAELHERVRVNGVKAVRTGREFAAEVALREKETDLVAVAEGPLGRTEHRVRVVWDRHSRRRYRMSIDDNSFFFRDIVQKGCKSLFDCFYLKILRDLHARFGTKFTVNVFFQTPEADFNLSQFPDRYKGQWSDNADWLKLAFHARQEFPDRPYQYSGPEKLARDFDAVAAEIHRFAGAAAYCPPTVLHWAMCQPDCYGVLGERGVKALSTLLARLPGGWDINYMLSDAQSDWLYRHDALRDFGSGITFSNCDIVLNATPLEQVVPTLQRMTGAPQTSEVLDLFTHEQYFWPFYHNYRPDHAQRLDAAFKWATENGYEAVFFHEGLLGAKE